MTEQGVDDMLMTEQSDDDRARGMVTERGDGKAV